MPHTLRGVAPVFCSFFAMPTALVSSCSCMKTHNSLLQLQDLASAIAPYYDYTARAVSIPSVRISFAVASARPTPPLSGTFRSWRKVL